MVNPPTEWIQHLYGDEVAVVSAVLMDWITTHKDDPEAKDMIRTLQDLEPPRRVK
jgi:hypothetical protein